MTSEQEIAWLAGLLEGEGAFMLGKNWVNKKAYIYPVIVVSMTDKDVVDRVAAIFGNTTYCSKPQESHWKLLYSVSTSGSRAVVFLKKILPFMGERRRKKITEILDYWAKRPSSKEMRSATMKVVASKRKHKPHGGGFAPNEKDTPLV